LRVLNQDGRILDIRIDKPSRCPGAGTKFNVCVHAQGGRSCASSSGRESADYQRRLRGQLLSHLVENLALRRKAPFLFLREDGFTVDRDDEDSAAAADDFAVDSEFPFDLSRQTGGSWEVVSNAAVVDSNMHMRN
jgi:hypothetical protein